LICRVYGTLEGYIGQTAAKGLGQHNCVFVTSNFMKYDLKMSVKYAHI